jgi:hypothetical protein
MKLELKAIKHSAFASQETHCYNAALFVDGKPLAIVSNQGHGGCDDEHQHPKSKLDNADYRAAMREVYDHFKAMPEKECKCGTHRFMHQPDLEGWCGDQVNLHLSSKDLKRMLKSKVVLHCTADNAIYTVKGAYTAARSKGIKAANNGHTILNELPFDEALELFSSK